MKSNFPVRLTFLFLICWPLISCVSVQLPTGKSEPAQGVAFQSPPSPFKEISTPQIDRSWLSEDSGNTISYFSNCNSSADPALQTLESDALNALNDLEIESTEELTFNGRAARKTSAKGQVDGVPMQLSLLVFKKNNCNYTLTYGGLQKSFARELNIFQKFLESFQAP